LWSEASYAAQEQRHRVEEKQVNLGEMEGRREEEGREKEIERTLPSTSSLQLPSVSHFVLQAHLEI
jgi:hypothetical protein